MSMWSIHRGCYCKKSIHLTPVLAVVSRARVLSVLPIFLSLLPHDGDFCQTICFPLLLPLWHFFFNFFLYLLILSKSISMSNHYAMIVKYNFWTIQTRLRIFFIVQKNRFIMLPVIFSTHNWRSLISIKIIYTRIIFLQPMSSFFGGNLAILFFFPKIRKIVFLHFYHYSETS